MKTRTRVGLVALAVIATAATGVGCRRHAKVKSPSARASSTPAPASTEPSPVDPSPTAPAPTATGSAPAAASSGTCAASCAHYLGCKGLRDPRLTETCMTRCGQLARPAADMAKFEALPCPAAIAAIEGAPGQQAGGSLKCPAPTAEKRTPQEEQIFQVVTTRRFCGWTYNAKSGVSKEMQLVFAPDGLMQHGVKAERSVSFTGPTGQTTGSWVSNSAGTSNFCWKYTGGLMLYSSDGVNYANFVSKVEDNGYGVIFFKTPLGEFKACN